jgi:thiol:disulfide interchange protein DsbD
VSAWKAAPDNAELFSTFKAQLPRDAAPPFQVSWDRSKANEFSLLIKGLAKDFNAEFFPLPPTKDAKPGHQAISAIAEDGTRTITFPVESGAPNLPWRGVLVTGQVGTPREGWTLDATTSAVAKPADIAAASAGKAPANLATLLWSAFLGGLILNLMPCVLPVIALKIFGFVQQAGQDPRRIFRLGLAFVAGVFAFFLSLAGLIAILRVNGIGLSWGAQFGHLGTLIALIVLIFLFGLNMLGVFEITLGSSTASKLSELSSKEGVGGAFLHGMFTTLLGASCTAPFLGVVLGVAFTGPAHISFLLFTAIAAGMSLPYFLLTANPAWMRFLPKPGAWMERLKQVMGFVLLGVVVWLLGVLGAHGNDKVTAVSAFLLLLAMACWIYSSFQRSAISWLCIVALVAGGYFRFLHPKAEDKDRIVWQPWSEARIAEAIKAGEPVFVDFTADWCLNCKAIEGAVIETKPVRAALKEKKVLTLKADYTKYDPVVKATLNRFGRAGVPLYIIYPGGQTDPVVLPETPTRGDILAELDRIKN